MKFNQTQANRSESAQLLQNMAREMGNAVLKVEYAQCSDRVQFRGPLGEKANRKYLI
jgi:hypothetical protein